MTFIQGDCLTVLKDTATDSIDLIVTDPPYGLEFMGKDWDRVVVPTETPPLYTVITVPFASPVFVPLTDVVPGHIGPVTTGVAVVATVMEVEFALIHLPVAIAIRGWCV